MMRAPQREAVSSAPLSTGSEALTVKRVNRAHLLALGESWDSLSANAAVENPYYARPYAEALLQHIEPDLEIEALCVFAGATLVGLLPFESTRRHWFGLGRINLAWSTPYTMSTMPLIRKGYEDATVDALVTAMAEVSESAYWLFNNLPTEPSLVQRLRARVAESGGHDCEVAAYKRPALSHGAGFDEHMRERVSKNRRKGLKRNRRRLDEFGLVRFTNSNSGLELAFAVEAFLRIEASGWKGRAGTALDCHEHTRVFGLAAFGPQTDNHLCRADCLWLEDEIIAVSLSLQQGRVAHTLKAAYDETYRSCAPGLLLEEEIVRQFLEGNWADQLDSATGPGHPLEGLWGDEMALADLFLTARPLSSTQFRRWCQVEQVKRHARGKVKQVYHQIRDRLGK